jgi:hypothetical protein
MFVDIGVNYGNKRQTQYQKTQAEHIEEARRETTRGKENHEVRNVITTF